MYDKNGIIILKCNKNAQIKCFTIEQFKNDEIFQKCFEENILKVLDELVNNEEKEYPFANIYSLTFYKEAVKQAFYSVMENKH